MRSWAAASEAGNSDTDPGVRHSSTSWGLPGPAAKCTTRPMSNPRQGGSLGVNSTKGTNGSAAVVLVPGVGFGGLEMVPLARRLAERGYETRVFWHSPWRRHPSESARALHRMVASLEADT